MLRERAHGSIAIQGYTDALGTDSYNQRLSERRAVAVKAWLGEKEGLANLQFKIAGFGARNPVAPTASQTGQTIPRAVSAIAA